MISVGSIASRFGISVGATVLCWGVAASGQGVLVPEKAVPSYTAQKLVRALAAASMEEALSLFVSREKINSMSPSGVSAAEYREARESFRRSIQDLLNKNVPIARAKFVEVDFRECPEPVAIPRGSVMPSGETIPADLCMYDDLRVVITMDRNSYSFDLGVMILDGGRWALGTPIRDLTRLPRKLRPIFSKMLEHHVSKGESLHIIADMYATEVAQILLANPEVKDDGDLKPSTVLKVPYE